MYGVVGSVFVIDAFLGCILAFSLGPSPRCGSPCTTLTSAQLQPSAIRERPRNPTGRPSYHLPARSDIENRLEDHPSLATKGAFPAKHPTTTSKITAIQSRTTYWGRHDQPAPIATADVGGLLNWCLSRAMRPGSGLSMHFRANRMPPRMPGITIS